jgi:hypothetical protein
MNKQKQKNHRNKHNMTTPNKKTKLKITKTQQHKSTTTKQIKKHPRQNQT